jgi:hypothetical protein
MLLKLMIWGYPILGNFHIVCVYIYIHIVLIIYTNIISLKLKNKALALARRGICWPRLKVNHGRLEALQPDGISGTRNISGTDWI